MKLKIALRILALALSAAQSVGKRKSLYSADLVEKI